MSEIPTHTINVPKLEEQLRGYRNACSVQKLRDMDKAEAKFAGVEETLEEVHKLLNDSSLLCDPRHTPAYTMGVLDAVDRIGSALHIVTDDLIAPAAKETPFHSVSVLVTRIQEYYFRHREGEDS